MKKAILGIAAGLAVLVFFIVRVYNSVQADEWTKNKEAAETVTRNTYITDVTRVESFQSDQSLSIVFGKDRDGKEAVAWVGDGEVHMEYLSQGVSEEAVRNKVLQKNPDAQIERILPGKLNGEYVWEVFYKRNESDGFRYYYDYYRFKDGTLLDTWRLSKQR